MKTQITSEQVIRWMQKRSNELARGNPDFTNNAAFQLGAMAQTFASLLNNPHQRRDLAKEIAEA